MKIGAYFDFRNPLGEPEPKLYRELLDVVEGLDRLGFDAVFSSEHHFADVGYSPSVLPLAAAMAVRTTRVKIGTCVLLLPLHHPIRVAEDAATVDIISNGRFILGAGVGWRPEEFHGLGVDLKHRGSLMEEALQIIIGCWTHEEFSFQGRHFQFSNVKLRPRPVQRPRPPIWLGGRAAAAIDRIVRLGDVYMLSELNEKEGYANLQQALQRHGRRPEDCPVTGAFWLHVAETTEQAWKEAREPLLCHRGEFKKYFDESQQRDDAGRLRKIDSDLEELVRQDKLFIGDPATVAAGLRRLRSRVPLEMVIVPGNLPGMPTAISMKSHELLATRVLPLLG